MLRRLFLGPALPTQCSECGAKVGVSYWSMLSVVPLPLTLLFCVWMPNDIAGRLGPLFPWLLGVVGASSLIAVALLFPLQKR